MTEISRFSNITEAAKAVGCESTHISRACREQSRTTGNFYWRYTEQLVA